MPQGRPLNLLCLSGYFKGERFMQRAHELGAKVYLLTQAKLLKSAWPRDCLVDVFAQPDNSPLQATLNTVSYLARTIDFDVIVPLDDYDVETAAALREHLRTPGMGDTTARHFRDKLAMRVKALAEGIAVPPFVHVLNHDRLREFMASVPAPWMFKPRSEASATGIVKIETSEQLWRVLDDKGDRQSHYLLEKYLPGDVYHVDSIISERKVVFAAVHRCGKPPFNVAHGGGIFTTHTVARGSTDETELVALNAKLLTSLGLVRGVSHTEYIKHSVDGRFYMLETSARVGGAHIAEMVEASSGINLWSEWADIELARGLTPYTLPKQRAEYGGVLMTLSRQKHPDFSSYQDPEIYFRAPEDFHAGLVLRASTEERVDSLIHDYSVRFMNDFYTSLPAAEKPSH